MPSDATAHEKNNTFVSDASLRWLFEARKLEEKPIPSREGLPELNIFNHTP